MSVLKADINEVWELVDSLTLEEKRIIYRKLEQEISAKLLAILDKVNERAEKDPIGLEEITQEVENVRSYKAPARKLDRLAPWRSQLYGKD